MNTAGFKLWPEFLLKYSHVCATHDAICETEAVSTEVAPVLSTLHTQA